MNAKTDQERFANLLNENGGPDEQVFAEPWQAQAFSLAVNLHQKGLFSWAEWSETIGAKLANQTSAGVEDYFAAWLDALQTLIVEKQAGNSSEIHQLTEEWREAYRTTPHGKPVTLSR